MTCPKYTPPGYLPCTRDPSHTGPCAHYCGDTPKVTRRALFKRAVMPWLGALGRASLGWLAMVAIAAFFYGFVVALINWPEVALVVIFVVGFTTSVWAAKR